MPRRTSVPARELLKLSFVFVAVGYGTKIGFVPMHSWLPDAHAEAPAPISALLSAVLLNCALYALLRLEAITSHAIGGNFSHTLLLVFGGLSLTVAALLMIVQRDLKRLLAYSSIEHMGIVALGVGLGGRSVFLGRCCMPSITRWPKRSCSSRPAMSARPLELCVWTGFAAWDAHCLRRAPA